MYDVGQVVWSGWSGRSGRSGRVKVGQLVMADASTVIPTAQSQSNTRHRVSLETLCVYRDRPKEVRGLG